MQAKPAGNAEAGARFRAGLVGAVVELAALGGEAVLRPDLLEMDEGPLALAEDEVLEAGEGEEIVFVKHSHLARRPTGSVGLPAASQGRLRCIPQRRAGCPDR